MIWYLKPWRLLTLAIGVAGLLYGARVEGAADWDTGVSLLMAGTTYLLMPHFDRYTATWRTWPLAFLVGDFAVNGVYTLYWGWKDPTALYMIWGNYPASWVLFLACWLVWCWPEKTFTKPTVSFRRLLK